MAILYLIPLALLILPIVIIVVIINHGTRLSVIEKTVAELKEKIKAGIQVADSNGNTIPIAPIASTTSQSLTPQHSLVQPSTVQPEQINTNEPVTLSEDSSGKILGRIGIAAVLIGIAFFLKYAFDNNWIGPAGRVMIGILAGIGFIGIGQSLRAKYLQYSDLLMGGGIAILYLSVFSAHSFYNLIDSPTTAVFMFLITLLSFAMSIFNATQILALVSVIGAFATPFLVGSHDNSMLILFIYLTIINAGVLGVSYFKKWSQLNLASFVGTAINFIVWFTSYYSPDVLSQTITFCTITFAIFLVANLIRNITIGIKADETDYLLMGANAMAFGGIVYSLLNPQYHSTLSFVFVLIALVYMGVAYITNKANPEDKALNIFLPGLAVVFLSAAVPLQFSGPSIAVAWFVESCFLYAVAFITGNRGFQVMGLVVYILGLLDFTKWYVLLPRDSTFNPFFNTPFVMFLLAIVSAYIIAYIYKKYGSVDAETQQRGILAFTIIANVLSIWALTVQITSYYSINANITSDNISNTLVSIVWTLYAAVLTAIGFAQRMVSLRRFGLVLFMITAFKVLIDVWNLGELYRIISFIGFGIIALVASFAYVKYRDRLKEIL